ncbi:serine hydrolase domain-containing protein [Fulvivirgaceae bacterium BMA12]|uniref:Serine hydrolase domain-containing protein n=1 Tax=Agaribacillus aureus TaxID=3051825 RepID=A0ABT8L430_9BACT|nr:serine hydrolase domain-containing protein [Fulvivirgaceae bacterium BMA12]
MTVFLLESCTQARSGDVNNATAHYSSALEPAKPEEAGMSSTRLQRIDTFFQKAIDQGWLPGAVNIIARHGKIVYYKNMGWSDIEGQKRQKKDDLFRLASMTKAFISVGVMILYEEGHFLLDDPISDFIPEYKTPRVLVSFNPVDTSYTTQPAKREITIRDLLTHTSGIAYGFYDKRFKAIYDKAGIPVRGVEAPITIEKTMKAMGGLPLKHHPGEEFTYGFNTDLLGYFIETVSGMNLAEFLDNRLFKPLGIKDTYFYIPDHKADRLVKVYGEWEKGKLEALANKGGQFSKTDYPLVGARTYFAGGGGMSGTAMDYAIFLQMLLNKGTYNGHRILSPKTVALMCKNQIGNVPLGTLGERVIGKNRFGLGFSVATESGSTEKPGSVGRLGWGGTYNTLYWFDPKEDLLAISMTQVYPTQHGELHDKFEVLTYQALVE